MLIMINLIALNISLGGFPLGESKFAFKMRRTTIIYRHIYQLPNRPQIAH